MSHSRASRAIVITEASSPIALASAARLAADGELVLMGTRRIDMCERFAAQLRADGAAVFAAHLDFADPPSIDRFVESADYLIGSVDVLVSAAGLADGSWVGAQHLAAQVIPPMIDNRRGDVVLISPGLVGASTATADRMLEAWVAALDAEFVGTGVRASIIRSTGTGGSRPLPPGDVGRLIAAAISSPERMHLRVLDVIAPVPAASRSMPAR
ncbi:MAG TPA: SDR family NAD(P)-dependent oxidoreductase [Mycobacterium sp.]|uniref:SDR family NAD(P)-dependent oxidoreductase n=1 Tax=Mycobacterium sp. TaxID=1785 RepID=UPI002D2D546B|nr:SDR family NAD(P)-dependent oxidoreductase [Mycobacterium sp.]HXY66835.1 SDR family NAD(P)-dependent oxidoreductase [Mycobacterium sp.]